jgi:pyridoxine 5-phosphate synthase
MDVRGETAVLGVNIDHVATLRQARGGSDPEPLIAASLALLGGADGITVHLREDRRHINDRDLRLLKELAPPELNLEMAPTAEMVKIALHTMPDMATLVPEKRAELTTEGGLDLSGQSRKKISEAVRKLQDAGIAVSLFIDPAEESIERAAGSGARMVEIHTGPYANARDAAGREAELKKTARAAALAVEAGLLVNAGHGLNYLNVKPVAALEGLRGLYIGHSIISRAVFTGLGQAVNEMKKLIAEAAGSR